MIVSTAPAYLDALFVALKARSGLAGVQVQQTYPGDTLQAKAIYAGKVQIHNDTPVRAGTRTVRQEEYTAEVLVDVCETGNDWTKARNTAFGIAGEVDDQLAGNAVEMAPTSTASVIFSKLSMNDAQPYWDEMRHGWAWLLKLEIAVSARLK